MHSGKISVKKVKIYKNKINRTLHTLPYNALSFILLFINRNSFVFLSIPVITNENKRNTAWNKICTLLNSTLTCFLISQHNRAMPCSRGHHPCVHKLVSWATSPPSSAHHLKICAVLVWSVCIKSNSYNTIPIISRLLVRNHKKTTCIEIWW